MKLHCARLARYAAPIRVAIFLLTLLVLWLPLAAPLYWLLEDPNQVSILTMIGLYIEFIVLAHWWGRHVHQHPNILKSYGLYATLQNGLELIWGLAFGFVSISGMFLLQGWMGWLSWQIPILSFSRLFQEGLLVALGVGFAEELFFRGWLLDELQRDYSRSLSLGINSALFAVAHFIRPWKAILATWPQFVGLAILGLILVWAKRAKGRKGQENLGLPMGFHAGLVWGYYLVNVGQWVDYSGQVPDWVTGIDGNPLAGLVGLGGLGAIALYVKHLANLKTASSDQIQD